MRFDLRVIVVVTLIGPYLTQGLEVVDDTNDGIVAHRQQGPFEHYRSRHFASRVLVEDVSCVNTCGSDGMSRFMASMTPNVAIGTDNEVASGFFGRIIGRISGFFDDSNSTFNRLMNSLLRLFNQREDNPKSDPTNTILPLLSNYSTKFKSLAEMIRQENEKDVTSSKTPEVIQMMYNLSASNMDSVVNVLDPIIYDMEQNKVFDGRATLCNMMQILTLLRDITVPNIQWMAGLIYNNTDNSAMKNMYTESSSYSSSNAAMEGDMCPKTSNWTSTTRRYSAADARPFNTTISDDIGPIGHTARIFLLILLFPLSFVVSFLGIILFIINTIELAILMEDDDSPWGDFLERLISTPLIVLSKILDNIRGLMDDISQLSVAMTETDASQQDFLLTSDVMHQLSIVLESPIETIVTLVQNKNSFSDVSKSEEENDVELDCEMSTLMRKNNALLDVLPF